MRPRVTPQDDVRVHALTSPRDLGTSHLIALARAGFARVVPIRDIAAALFYGRLLETYPTTRPETILPAAEDLARRHVGYGVTKAQYATVGAALLWTLRQGLGEAFTPEVEAAWAAAYVLLSGAMIAAAREVEPAAKAA